VGQHPRPGHSAIGQVFDAQAGQDDHEAGQDRQQPGGIAHPHGSGLGTYRWVVEQTLALLHWFRRLRIRWEIRDDIHAAFLALACSIICWRRLKKSFCQELLSSNQRRVRNISSGSSLTHSRPASRGKGGLNWGVRMRPATEQGRPAYVAFRGAGTCADEGNRCSNRNTKSPHTGPERRPDCLEDAPCRMN